MTGANRKSSNILKADPERAAGDGSVAEKPRSMELRTPFVLRSFVDRTDCGIVPRADEESAYNLKSSPGEGCC